MIRKVEKEDLDAVMELYQHLNKNGQVKPDLGEIEKVWDEILTNDKYFNLFVNVYEDRVVASAILTLVPNLSRGCRPYGLVENVVTHSDFRGKGFGSEVLQYCLEYAWENDCYKVMLLTGSKRLETIGFYEKNGFQSDLKTGFVAYP